MLCTGIKKYIVGLIIKTSSDASLMEREKVYLGKLNVILVQACCCSRILTVISTAMFGCQKSHPDGFVVHVRKDFDRNSALCISCHQWIHK